MNVKALVIGNNVAALVTALKLQQRGCSVCVFEHPDRVEQPATLPLVFHGPRTYTQSLLQEAGILSSLKNLKPVPLEFLSPSNRTTAFRPAYLPSPWHAVMGLLRCSVLSRSSRWKFLNYVEKIWEGVIHLPQELHLQTARDWLISAGQDEEACRQFWSPLCFFLLNDYLEQTAAWTFIQTLKQHFLAARTHSTISMSPLPLKEFLIAPLRSLVQRQGGAFFPNAGLPQFHMTGDHIESLSINGGQTHRADVYVSAVSPFQLTDLLPERLLARLGFFHRLNQLNTVPEVVLHCFVPESGPKDRLVLTSNPFQWMTRQQIRSNTGQTLSRISCIAIADEALLSASDEKLQTLAIQEIRRVYPELDPSHISSIEMTRQSRAFITHAPGTMTFRPSHHTPISNLFLAGYWTERDGEPTLEADIHSAHLCVESINSVNVSSISRR